MFRLRITCAFFLACGGLTVSASRTAYAHGQALPFAFWGHFSTTAVQCQKILAVTAAQCATRAWKAHTKCFNALLDGQSCPLSGVPDLVQRAHLDALNAIDVQCTSPEAQALGFLLKYEAQTDMNNFCYALESAMVSGVYGPVVVGQLVRQVDQHTRVCIEATEHAATRLMRFAFRDRRHTMDLIAAGNWDPVGKQTLIHRSSMHIAQLRGRMQQAIEAVCAPADFAALYHHDAGALLTLIAQRADCMTGAVYVQPEILCPAAVCGNGMQEAGEECDDGNLTNGDGCSSLCVLE